MTAGIPFSPHSSTVLRSLRSRLRSHRSLLRSLRVDMSEDYAVSRVSEGIEHQTYVGVRDAVLLQELMLSAVHKLFFHIGVVSR